MKLIGLTGNIASGKSSVARLLIERGAVHLDADALVHELYRPGTEVTSAIAAQFGEQVLAPDGSVERRALGEIVFSDAAALRALEGIVHPHTGRIIAERMEASATQPDPPPAMVIEAVKLIESGRHSMMDQVWFVVARPEVQGQRLMENRGWSEAEAQARLEAQAPIKERLHLADVIIENSGSLETLERQVSDGWERLITGTVRRDKRA
ncbi:MAG: dephospho-CoA kinase [Ardenticatenales bacterium]|nr:dephospho-CoA kinase [Ardenticatenales bacterium]